MLQRNSKRAEIELLKARVVELEAQVAELKATIIPPERVKDYVLQELHNHQGFMSVTKLTTLLADKFSISEERADKYLLDLNQNSYIHLAKYIDTVMNPAAYRNQP